MREAFTSTLARHAQLHIADEGDSPALCIFQDLHNNMHYMIIAMVMVKLS